MTMGDRAGEEAAHSGALLESSPGSQPEEDRPDPGRHPELTLHHPVVHEGVQGPQPPRGPLGHPGESAQKGHGPEAAEKDPQPP